MKQNQENYNHKLSEAKWQKAWNDAGIFKLDEKSAKEKYYVLEMFPYPSGKIHMGHLRNYAIGDVIARFKMMEGFNVLHPMGFDSFGLPAENAALEHGVHPRDWTLKNIETMKSELKMIGLSVDWEREIATCLPNYYKHEQEIFLDFVKAGLAYQKESYVNWDPIDNTVLANEQVIDGRGWRSGALVEKKKLTQWFLKVSEFSQELLDELKNLKGWDERVLAMQENWIGRSEGLKLKFEITENGGEVEVYTTRPDTLFGASFIAISPNHPIATEISLKNPEIKAFIDNCNKSAVDEASLEKQPKNGIKTGLKAIHPFDKNIVLDIFIANFVLMDYGTGAVFGCPAHDERDFEFAKKYDLKIKQVVANFEEFLQKNEIINFLEPKIQEIATNLHKNSKNETDFVEKAYNFVRDEINHCMDDKSFLSQKPFLKASEVLENKIGFCFGKCALLAAILRAKNVPCGFSDQLLMLDEDISDKKIIHTLNAVYLRDLKKWIRLDPRGNKPEDVNAKFDLDNEFLAYEARQEFDEINNLGIYANLPKEVFELYEKSKNNAEIIDNLFDKTSAMLINKPFCEDGIIINSEFLSGLSVADAKKKAIEKAILLEVGQKQINYRLRDWGVSRQRYWGCPIPMLYLEDGRVVAVPKDQLPLELPDDVVFDGKGNPLDSHPTWKYTTFIDEDGTKHKATRETDTFDTFFESSWYFLRFISPRDENQAFDRDLVNKFMPVDQYIGGVEHAVLHLLYARFFVKALKKCGYLDFNEPFKNLLTQGMVCHKTFKNEDGKWVFPSDVIEKNGELIDFKSGKKVQEGRSEKMSKSKKNVVEPAGIIDAYGADTARLFMLSDSPVDRDLEWSDSGIDGAWRYVNRVWKLVCSFVDGQNFNVQDSKKDEEIIKLSHKTIKEVGEEYQKMGFNRAIAKIREFSNTLEKFEGDKKTMHQALKTLTLLIAPIMPHLAEECWSKLGEKNLVANEPFPQFDEKLTIDSSVKIAIQVLGKLRSVIEVAKGLSREELEKLAREDFKVAKFLENKEIKKVIVIPDKLVNFVVV